MYKSFNTKIIVVILLLIIANLIGSFLVVTKLNSIKLLSDSKDGNVILKNGEQSVYFISDHNINYDELVSKLLVTSEKGEVLKHEKDYTINVLSKEWQIDFTESIYNTKINILVPQNITDISGRKHEKEINVSIEMLSPTLYYLENSEPELIVKDEVVISKKYFNKDKIVRSNVDGTKKEIIVEDYRIKEFIVQNGFVIYIAKVDDERANLFFYDIEEKKLTKLELNDHRYISLVANPANELQFAVGIQQNIRKNNTYFGGKGYYLNIFEYDIVTNLWKSKEFNPNNTALDATQILWGRDGKSIMYRGSQSNYYIASLESSENSQDEILNLGLKYSSGGFSYKNKFIVSNEYDIRDSAQTIQVQDSNLAQIEIEVNKSEYALDPIFFNKSQRLILTEYIAELDFTKGIYHPSIFEYNGTSFVANSDLSKIWSKDVSVENPKISLDDRYISFEIFNISQLQNSVDDERLFGTMLKPEFGSIAIYDTKEKKIIMESFPGINAYWK